MRGVFPVLAALMLLVPAAGARAERIAGAREVRRGAAPCSATRPTLPKRHGRATLTLSIGHRAERRDVMF